MNHVMFGGLTHEPAARLAQLLVEITPTAWTRCSSPTPGRCRSGGREDGAAVLAQPGRFDKHRLMTWRGGYHGDTFTPMSVCDPDGGMHSLWTDVLVPQVFARRCPRTTTRLQRRLRGPPRRHADELAAVIVEPVVQGAGGMRFHDPATSPTCGRSATATTSC